MCCVACLRLPVLSIWILICTCNISFLSTVPAVANVHSYQVLEQNGFVYIWYHAEGVEPYWTPPVIDEIANKEWTYRGRTEHVINCHIEVIVHPSEI